MKKYGAVVALVVAALFGVLAVFMVNKWMTGREGGEKVIFKDTTPVAKIVIAAQEINMGTVLNENNLTLASWPRANRPEGAFEEISKVQGRVAISKLVPGEPLLAAELAAPGSGAGLVALIPKGMRAMSIKVDEVIGVAGFILPNSYVDVISVETRQGKSDKVETILKKIKVLAIAQETLSEDGQAKVVRTVTLQVEPGQSERLALQTSKGRVHLVLRNPLEHEKIKVAAARPRPKRMPVLKSKVQVPRRGPFGVEVIRGSDREKLHFKNSKSAERV
ncbi:MAG: Flp pilus assembly protein CpaB [Thermodesulfobacteriota bacterium]|nr:Flp pilus assembly protein CpaB [Thermodesulfobacteriota bacterium]